MLRVPEFEVTFDGRQIRGPQIDLAPGDLVELHGPSGSGCDTLLFLLAGMLPHLTRTAPAEVGRIRRTLIRLAPTDLPAVALNGENLHYLTETSRAAKVGFVFAEPEVFILGETVWEEMKYGFAAVRREPPRIQVLADYGLYEKANYRTETLSCGEQHRLNWASVLELRPQVILADLSTANLDQEFLKKVRSWLISTRFQRIAVLHGVPRGMLGSVARVWNMHDGELVFAGPDDTEIPMPSDARTRLGSEFVARPPDSLLLEVIGLCRAQVTLPTSFRLHRGEVLQISGPNGSGKTTIGKILTGQVRGAAVGGSTRPLASSLSSAMSFQYPGRSFLSGALGSDLQTRRVIEICELSAQELAAEPRSLPFSRQKLAAVGVTLEVARDLVVLDEPTAGMDFADKLRFVRLLNAYPNLATIIMSHDPDISSIGRTVNWDEIRA